MQKHEASNNAKLTLKNTYYQTEVQEVQRGLNTLKLIVCTINVISVHPASRHRPSWQSLWPSLRPAIPGSRFSMKSNSDYRTFGLWSKGFLRNEDLLSVSLTIQVLL